MSRGEGLRRVITIMLNTVQYSSKIFTVRRFEFELSGKCYFSRL